MNGGIMTKFFIGSSSINKKWLIIFLIAIFFKLLCTSENLANFSINSIKTHQKTIGVIENKLFYKFFNI